ncbi:phosphodiesterase, partial [Bacillus toyonensis]
MGMEMKEQYDLYERYKTCMYCDSDEAGNITRLECG